MSDDSAPAAAALFEGRLLFEAKVSGFVRVSATGGALQIFGPFGTLAIPFSQLRKVTRDVVGGIRLDATGARLWLDVNDFPDRAALYGLLQQKIGRRSPRATDLG